MGQKINPVSLRLQYTNRNFDNCWYSNSFYKTLISKDLFLHHYLDNFLKLLKLPTGRYSIHHLQKKTQIFNFFCDSKSTREWRTQLFGLTQKRKVLKKNRYFFKKNSEFKKTKKNFTKFSLFYKTLNQLAVHKIQKKITSFQNFQLWSALEKTKYSNYGLIKQTEFFYFPLNSQSINTLEKFPGGNHSPQDFTKFLVCDSGSLPLVLKNSSFLKIHENSNLPFLQNLLVYKTLKSSLNDSIVRKFQKNQFKPNSNPILSAMKDSTEKISFNAVEYKYQKYLESSLSSLYNFELNLVSFKVKNDWQHAHYLANEIVYFLEKRIPFRRLKKRILKQLSQISTIRGVRITCSGRVGGKSKKAQRAKTECIKYGQTSLQVFSSKIDFSMKTAFTSFGSVGVKVWICYN